MKRLEKDDTAISKAIKARDAKIDRALPIGCEVSVRVGRGAMPGTVVSEARNGRVLVQSCTARRKRHWKWYADVDPI